MGRSGSRSERSTSTWTARPIWSSRTGHWPSRRTRSRSLRSLPAAALCRAQPSSCAGRLRLWLVLEVGMPSFAHDVGPMFRDKDLEEMRFAFDLSEFEDVKSNAAGIYERLAEGSM